MLAREQEEVSDAENQFRAGQRALRHPGERGVRGHNRVMGQHLLN